jgi:formamidopyrimidine-DNA glycosylase
MPVPELPEVESARAAIEKAGLGRKIIDVDDTDIWECRPHKPGEIRAALLGRTLMGAFRRGKSMWCETSGIGRSRTPGPLLGIHLGMSGRILISGADGRSAEGGDWLGNRYGQDARWLSASRSGIASPSPSPTAVSCGYSTSGDWVASDSIRT